MDIIYIIAGILLAFIIQYYLIASAVKSGTKELREVAADLLSYKIVELKKTNLVNDNDIEQIDKDKKIGKWLRKLQRGTITQSEFIKQRDKILEN